MQSIISQITAVLSLFQQNMHIVLSIILVLFIIHLINWLLGYRLNILGIYPRNIFGTIGIFFSPFLHGHFNHLFFNAIPLFILMSFLLIQGLQIFIVVSAMIILMGGIGTWVIGRKGLHVGASGLIMGYWSFLLIQAYYHPTALSVALAFICIYYFGGMLFNLFPSEVTSSWEAHVSGFIAGLITAYLLPTVLLHLPISFRSIPIYQ